MCSAKLTVRRNIEPRVHGDDEVLTVALLRFALSASRPQSGIECFSLREYVSCTQFE